ncbi:MAG: glutamine--tRNA ligase, partial [Bacteroidales bacterium]|nr:glutamine--tRNA ligase [Bacteroidales bacterium]
MKKENATENSEKKASLNFIEQIIEGDLQDGYKGEVHTRFPPEPNGYLHIGHAKSIILNYGMAKKYNGKMNVRFDDTNPTAEKTEYVDAIREDLHWLGAEWDDREYYASNYFEQLYEWAVMLIKQGKAYVCQLTPEELSA